jgi:MYXO-CTERM domain-containing protein
VNTIRKVTAILMILVLVAVFLPGPVIAAAPDGGGPVISHCCVLAGETDPEALVIWPKTPTGVEGTTGYLTGISNSGETFTIPLTFLGFFGNSAKWSGVGPDSGIMTITGGMVGIGGTQGIVRNVPFEFTGGASCTPTAINLVSLTAESTQNASAWLLLVGVVGAAVLLRRRK